MSANRRGSLQEGIVEHRRNEGGDFASKRSDRSDNSHVECNRQVETFNTKPLELRQGEYVPSSQTLECYLLFTSLELVPSMCW